MLCGNWLAMQELISWKDQARQRPCCEVLALRSIKCCSSSSVITQVIVYCYVKSSSRALLYEDHWTCVSGNSHGCRQPPSDHQVVPSPTCQLDMCFRKFSWLLSTTFWSPAGTRASNLSTTFFFCCLFFSSCLGCSCFFPDCLFLLL
jgi:hypothetical protein